LVYSFFSPFSGGYKNLPILYGLANDVRTTNGRPYILSKFSEARAYAIRPYTFAVFSLYSLFILVILCSVDGQGRPPLQISICQNKSKLVDCAF